MFEVSKLEDWNYGDIKEYMEKAISPQLKDSYQVHFNLWRDFQDKLAYFWLLWLTHSLTHHWFY